MLRMYLEFDSFLLQTIFSNVLTRYILDWCKNWWLVYTKIMVKIAPVSTIMTFFTFFGRDIDCQAVFNEHLEKRNLTYVGQRCVFFSSNMFYWPIFSKTGRAFETRYILFCAILICTLYYNVYIYKILIID